MSCQNCAHEKNKIKLSPLIRILPKTVCQIKSEKKLKHFSQTGFHFATKAKNLRCAQLNNFVHEKLENYFLLNEQLTRLIYGLNLKLFSSKIMSNLKSF